MLGFFFDYFIAKLLTYLSFFLFALPYNDTQASDKMGAGPPEQKAARKGFNIIEDCGTCGGKTRDTLEPGVLEGEGPAPKGIRQHAEDEGKQPGQCNRNIAFLQGYGMGAADEDEGKDANQKCNSEADGEGGQRAVVAVQYRNKYRQQHEQGAHQERQSYITTYCLPIHQILVLSNP